MAVMQVAGALTECLDFVCAGSTRTFANVSRITPLCGTGRLLKCETPLARGHCDKGNSSEAMLTSGRSKRVIRAG